MALLLVLWFHLAVAITFRLEVSAYDNSAWTYATVLLQAALEVVGRLTAADRDAWLVRCCRAPARTMSRATRLISPSGGIVPKGGRDGAAAREAVRREFRATLIAVEMFAEYGGMYIATYLLFCSMDMVLLYPVPAFRRHLELFDGVTDGSAIWKSLLMQVACEIATDTLCLVAETRKGIVPSALYRRLPRTALLPGFCLVLAFASISGTYRCFFGDRLTACKHQDLCECVGKGLRPDSMRQAYCQLLWPNSSGIPT